MDDLVGGFYEAAADASRWPAACVGISSRLGATSAMLFVEDRGCGLLTPLCMPSYSPDQVDQYKSYYHAVDPFVQATRDHQELGAVLGPALVKSADFERSELWNDFIAPSVRSFHFLCLHGLLRPNVVFGLAVHRPPEQDGFTEEERLRLQYSLPHIRRALQLAARLEIDQIATAAQTAALDMSALGILVCDGQARIFYANAIGEAAWRAHGLQMGKNGGLEPRSPRQRAALHRLIHETSSGGPGGRIAMNGVSGAFAISVCRLPGSLLPLCVPLCAPAGGLVLVQVRPSRAQLPSVSELRAAFGLTSAEAAVALSLASGRSGREVASQRKVSITTIRGQVRAILSKTGAGNLRALALALAAMP